MATEEAVLETTQGFDALPSDQQDEVVREYYEKGAGAPFDAWFAARGKDTGGTEEGEPAPTETVTGTEGEAATGAGEGEGELEESEATEGSTAETPATGDTISPDELKRLRNADQLMGKQALELGQLRQQMQTYQPFLTALNDPTFRAHIEQFYNPGAKPQTATQKLPEDFDPYNAEHVSKLVEQRVQAKLHEQSTQFQRQQAAQQMQAWSAKEQANRQRLIAGGRQEAEIMTAMQTVQKKFADGNIAEVAVKYANYDADIQAAEKRGYDKAKKEVREKVQSVPKRTAGGTAGKGGKSIEGKALSDYTAEELNEAIRTTSVGPAYEALGRELERRAR